MTFEQRTIGNATLYRGDALELLAAGLLKCDAIVSDPPYGIGFQHGGGGSGGAVSTILAASCTDPIIGDDAPFDPSPWLRHAPPIGDERAAHRPVGRRSLSRALARVRHAARLG